MSTFKLDLQFFAQKKAGGSANTNRSHDSRSKSRGRKCDDGEKIKKGAILSRQLGSQIHAGEGVGTGKDWTLYALKEGRVKYYTGRGGKTFVKILSFLAKEPYSKESEL